MDENGDVNKALQRTRAPSDVFATLSTGRSFVARGEFQETIKRIPETNLFTKTITGSRDMISDPGRGLIFQEAGRIVYGDLEQTILLRKAGKHEGIFDEDFDVPL